MSGTPKLSPFRAWVKPSRSTNGDALHSSSPRASGQAVERKADLKRAAFFATAAALFVLVNHLGWVRDTHDANTAPASLAAVSLTASRMEDGLSVRFRLSNRGNQPVFYPVGTGTSVLVGQIVARTSTSSDWTTLSDTSKHGDSGSQEITHPNVAWIEMPPGGWVDGEFRDERESTGEHAYAIFLKPARNANAIKIVSNSYPSARNQF